MKKTRVLPLALLLILSLWIPALAANETHGETKLTAIVEETYTAVIPEDAEIPYGALSTELGGLGLAQATLGPRRQVVFTADVTRTGEGALVHTDGKTALPYTLLLGGRAADTASFTEAGTVTVSVEISARAWQAASSGSYEDIIHFTVICTDTEG